ncbi:hypothetical protein [uncultured Brevundimonas sp.]|uniref:hypothetical protein n=1 Tax=uncultured Brevundimonas sp. TaxID=213418 RepID=UPI0025D91406|nr:hypothetical protein [uncultured Brevundimonas sp.]
MLFFAQKVEELSYSYSISSYKSRTVSLTGLITEAIDCLLQVSSLPQMMSHAEHIIDELRDRIKICPAAKHTLRLPVDRYLSFDLKNVHDSINQLKTLRAELSPPDYIPIIELLLIEEIEGRGSKTAIDILASELISTVQYHGISRDHISKAASDIFFGDSPVIDCTAISAFVQNIFPYVHQFTVYISISDHIKSIDVELLSTFDISIIDSVPSNINKKDHGKFLSDHRKNFSSCLAIDVEARDYFSAAESAKASIDVLSDLYRVFYHKWSHETGSLAVVEQKCCAGVFKEVAMPGNFMHYVKDSRPQKAQELLSDALTSVSFVRGPDRSRYLSLISMHGLSLQSTASDSQLINIWTCLETITPPKGHSSNTSNVANVVDNVVPVLMLGYIKRIVLTLFFDLARWDKTKLTSAFDQFGAFKANDSVGKLVEIITDVDRPEALEFMLAELDDFELLRFRLYTVATILRDRKLLRAKLDSHERNLRWQLHRIYRVRNKIVHAGMTSSYIKYLVENAHQYYDDVFDFCLGVSSTLPEINTFDLCFSYAKKHYQFYIDMLKSDQYLAHCVWETSPHTE